MTKLTKTEIHELGVKHVAMRLIEQGISTRNTEDIGNDLIMDNGKTILVRGMSEELRLAVGVNDLDDLKSDYLIVASNLKYTTMRKIYIMAINDVKNVAIDNPRRASGISDYFINRSEYAAHVNEYNILKE